MDLKSIVPWVKEELEKGRPKAEIYDEIGLNSYQRQNINAYLRYDAPPKEEPKYLIIPEKKKERKFITINGKVYEDITDQLIDCGG